MYIVQAKKAHLSKGGKRKKEKATSATLPVNLVFNENSQRVLVSEKDLAGEDLEAAANNSGSGYKFSIANPPGGMGIDDFGDSNR